MAHDVEADLESRINGMPSFCEPRLILRAQDPARYYAVGFPAVGQSWRAKVVWAAIWRVEANGMHHLLGVTAEQGRWYRGHVTCNGPEIRFSIEGRDVVSARDETYGPGAWDWGPGARPSSETYKPEDRQR